jgi:hypothetical protein
MSYKKHLFWNSHMRALVVAITFLGVMSAGLIVANQVNNSPDKAFAQSAEDPNNPGGGTTVLPIQQTTTSTTTTGNTTGATTGETTTGQTTTSSTTTSGTTTTSTTATSGTTTATTTSGTTSTTTGDSGSSTVQEPVKPQAESENIVEGTDQTTQAPQTTTATTNQPVVTANQVTQDNTVRSGGLAFTFAGFAIIGLAGWYYYHKVYGDPKTALKMDEKRIKKVR